MNRTFAALMSEGLARKRTPKGKPWGPSHLAAAIGLLEDGTAFNTTQATRLLTGERQKLTRDLVQRLIDVLDLTQDEADEAWHAAGLWPPGLDLAGYRRLRHLTATSPMTQLPGSVRFPVASELDMLIRRNRRRSDRRHLHLVKPVAA